MVDATGQKWLEFFAAGGRHDIPYNRAYIEQTRAAERTSNYVLGLGSVGAEVGMTALSATERITDLWFYGRSPNPVFGISGEGIHLPTIPLIRWEDIVAMTACNLRGVSHRANNRTIIPEPTVGSPNQVDPMESSLTIRRADQVKASIPDPDTSPVVTITPTASGQQWGCVVLRLDPGLGAEQVVELFYLLELMFDLHGIHLYQDGGLTGVFRTNAIEQNILRMN